MKKNLFMVAAVALMAMVSCNKEDMNNAIDASKPSYYLEFTASIDNEEDATVLKPSSVQTKTSYDSSKKTTCWSIGDEISVNGKKFRVEELINGGLQARFLNVEELGENFNAPYTAIYPYNATAGTAVVPSVQTVSNGTFADESVVTVAYAESGNELAFKHISTVIKFKVSTEGVKELKFSSASNIAGTINVNANEGGEPSFTVKTGVKEITVKPSSGSFKTNETYYVSVLPTSSASKFEIKAEGVTVKSGNVTFKRNKVMDAKSIVVKYVYLKPNGNWKMDSARFAANFFVKDSHSDWVSMSDTDNDGIFSCVVPDGYNNVVLCRMKPSTSNDWNNKWDQTNDLTLQTDTKNCYVVHIDEWSYGAGNWMAISDAKRIIYLLPTSEWDKDNARFAAYFYGNGEKWVSMTKFATNKYYVLAPTGYTKVIFCRMNGAQSTNNWDNKWNQTQDLSIPTNGNNTCTISNHWADKATGTWSTK